MVTRLMNKNLKISLAVLTSFIISFSVLVSFVIMFPITTDKIVFHGHPTENQQAKFYLQDFDPDEKKIFIFGSSMVWPLNPELIQENLKKNGLDYKVYNLGIGGSKPENTEKVLDMIISAKPTIIAYGVADRDFITDDWIVTKEKPPQPLPEPSRIFTNLFFSIENIFGFDTEFLSRPMLNTVNFLRGPLDAELLPITPDQTIKKDKEVETYLEDLVPPKQNKNFISLTNIITSLEENNIQVVTFVPPVHRYHIDNLSENQQQYFSNMLELISNENNIPVYSFYEHYRDMEIWYDFIHVTTDTNYPYFSNDFSEILLKEILS